MKKTIGSILLMAGVLAVMAAVHQWVERPGIGILYRVEGGKNSVYLLGSIHVGNKEMYPMPTSVKSVIDHADVLVFECDTASAEAQSVTARMMHSETPLSAKLDEKCLEKLKQASQKLGYQMNSFDRMKPWAVTSTLTVAAAAQDMNTGSRSASAWGVENMVKKLADQHAFAYLETVEEQLQLMDSFSPELQEYLLLSACDAVLDRATSAKKENTEMWPQWWREGNVNAFAEFYYTDLKNETSPELAQEYHQALVVERNRRMTQKLIAMLESEEEHSYVVTVGLMHLVLPEESLVEMLTDSGYCVTQILE